MRKCARNNLRKLLTNFYVRFNKLLLQQLQVHYYRTKIFLYCMVEPRKRLWSAVIKLTNTSTVSPVRCWQSWWGRAGTKWWTWIRSRRAIGRGEEVPPPVTKSTLIIYTFKLPRFETGIRQVTPVGPISW